MTESNVEFVSEKTIRKAERYLKKVDPVMAELVTQYGSCMLATKPYHPFYTLVRSIISQQLSTKAADTIESRIAQIIPAPFKPEDVMKISVKKFRNAGLANMKVRSILGVANAVVTGELCFETLAQQPDHVVVEKLIQLHGIGQWTATMFLIFCLKRLDVLVIGDAGLQRAVNLLYQAHFPKKRDDKLFLHVSKIWQPYRTVASWYLWQYLDSNGKNKKQ